MLFVITSCSIDTRVGNEGDNGNMVSFAAGIGVSSRACVSRATEGATAAAALGNSFTVYGYKDVNDVREVVFNGYEVDYSANSANTTETNSANWEYVGKGSDQSIKYWDYSSSRYSFLAVAPAGSATFTKNADGIVTSASIAGLTPEKKIYITDIRTMEKSTYGNIVTIPFKSALSRLRFGMYETIPGYAVKNVTCYVGDSKKEGFWVNGAFARSETLTLSYDYEAGKVICSAVPTAGTEVDGSYDFGALDYTVASDNRLTGTDAIFLGKTAPAATFAGGGMEKHYTAVLPNTSNTTPLTITVDYTLLSTDGSGQEIVVKGATAVVPVSYCQWQPNYSYTYLFKISDNTNGMTGGSSDPAGLFPITFAAYGEDATSSDNSQGTITTVGEYSITTYQECSTDTGGVSYVTNKAIQVSVIHHGDTKELVTLASGSGDYVKVYQQSSSYESVLETGGTDVTVSYDDGMACFTPSGKGTYRVEYWHKEGDADEQKVAVKKVKVDKDG